MSQLITVLCYDHGGSISFLKLLLWLTIRAIVFEQIARTEVLHKLKLLFVRCPLTREEGDKIADHYIAPNGRVCYRDFCFLMENGGFICE